MIRAFIFAAVLSLVLIGEAPKADDKVKPAEKVSQVAAVDKASVAAHESDHSPHGTPPAGVVELTLTAATGYYRIPGTNQRQRFEIKPMPRFTQASASYPAARGLVAEPLGSMREH